MFNVLENPWGLFSASIVGLIIIYTIRLDRKMYWLSLLVLACCVLLHLSVESSLLEFNRIISLALKVILPITIAGLTILLLTNIVNCGERSACLWLIPVFLCISAFALDWLVKTDMEKITSVINSGIKTVEEENCEGIAQILSEDYQDSYHKNKKELIQYCKRILYEPVVKNNRKSHQEIKINADNATASIVVWTSFEPDGWVFELGKTFMQTGARLHLKKSADKKWLINEVEILEIDKQQVNWSATKQISW